MMVQSRINSLQWAPQQVFEAPGDLLDVLPGEFEVHVDDLAFACSLDIVPGADRLLVALNPGQERGYPAFLTVATPPHCHLLHVADPSAPLTTAKFSCFIGTEAQDPVLGIVRIVEALCTELNIESSRVIFYGPSGGGFGALMCAARGCGSALAINAQTDFSEPHFSRLAAVLFDAFRPGASGIELHSAYPTRLSVAAALAEAHAAGRWPRLMLCQNSGDDAHYRHQYTRFCAAAGLPFEGGLDATGTLESVLYYQVGGHGGFWPERDVLREALARFTPIRPLREAGTLATGTTPYATPDERLQVESEAEVLPLSSYDAGWHRFIVPHALCQVKLTGLTFSPAELDPASTDIRQLGVAVEQIRMVVNDKLYVVNLVGGLMGPGWHAHEAGAGVPWRWTTGDAVLFLPPGAELLEIATTHRHLQPKEQALVVLPAPVVHAEAAYAH